MMKRIDKRVIQYVLQWDEVIAKCSRDNENNRWKKNELRKKKQKGTREIEAIVKWWGLNDFVVCLS